MSAWPDDEGGKEREGLHTELEGIGRRKRERKEEREDYVLS